MAMHFSAKHSTPSLTCIQAGRKALTEQPQYVVLLSSFQLYNVSGHKLAVYYHWGLSKDMKNRLADDKIILIEEA